MVESSMKYSMIPEAGGPIKRHCNGELYWALEMENLSLTEGDAVQSVPWRQSVNARDAGRLKSQFVRQRPTPSGFVPRPFAGEMERSSSLAAGGAQMAAEAAGGRLATAKRTAVVFAPVLRRSCLLSYRS